MITYYELLEDNTIGRSTPFADIAGKLGLTLSTEEEIVYAYDGKRYLKSQAPETPEDWGEPKTHEEIRAKRAELFTLEADPLKYDYEEACARCGISSKEAIHCKVVWLEKKDEIRERYPYKD